MRYLSVCSGIEAASMAWHQLVWTPVAFSEIEPFPSAVLAHHYPSVPNWGDMTKFKDWPDANVDLLVGGTPCQSFSVAGLRKGMADPRGNLALTYLAILDRYRPTWCCWENVPGVLSSDNGRAFGAFLGGLGQLGYGFAYRVLDAQYFGLAQRRARVFVVAHLGDWRRAAAVLFERASLSGHPAPRREAGQVAPTLSSSGAGTGRTGNERTKAEFLIPSTGDISHCLNAGGMGRIDYETETLIAQAFDWQSGGDSRGLDPKDTAQLQRCQVPAVAFHDNQRGELTVNDTAGSLKVGGGKPEQGYPAVAFGIADDETVMRDCLPTMATPSASGGGHPPAVAFQSSQSGFREVETHATLDANNGSRRHNGVMAGMHVRRLTPRECERLQGFPDDYTLIPYGTRGKPAKDGPRYKALGNSMAVPVMSWLGKRIAMVESLDNERNSVELEASA